MPKQLLICVLLVVCMLAGVARAAETWDVEYDGNGLPNSSVWTPFGVSSATYSANDKFTSGHVVPGWLTATGNHGGIFDGEFSPNTITKAGGWTAEWSFLSNPDLASQPVTELVEFCDDVNFISLRYDPDSVTLRDNVQLGQTVSLDTKVDHTYRLVREPDSSSVELYIDNNPSVAASFEPVAVGLDSSNLNHMYVAPSQYEAAYDFWRYHSGATLVPEPSMLSLLAGSLLLFRRKGSSLC